MTGASARSWKLQAPRCAAMDRHGFWCGMAHPKVGNHDKWFQNGEDISHLPTNYILGSFQSETG